MSELPRWLHPGAWWLWAIGMATAASRTTNPVYLIAIIVAVALVVDARRPTAPWAGAFAASVRLGLFIIVMRVLLQMFLGASLGSMVLIELPQVPLPEWMAGIRIGGVITVESVLAGFYDGLRLATIMMCVGAASSLASPTRLLKAMPAALYELGVAVVVAMTFAPQLVADAQRIAQARRLRGRPHTGIAGLAGIAGPVFDGALERSVALAAAMDSRGYGRSAAVDPKVRMVTNGLLLGGCVALGVGLFGLMDSGTPAVVVLPLVVLGVACSALAMRLAGRRAIRTTYRPDPWSRPEWFVCGSGLAVATAFLAAAVAGAPELQTSVVPLEWPAIGWLVLVPAFGILPARLAPPLPAAFVRAPEAHTVGATA